MSSCKRLLFKGVCRGAELLMTGCKGTFALWERFSWRTEMGLCRWSYLGDLSTYYVCSGHGVVTDAQHLLESPLLGLNDLKLSVVA